MTHILITDLREIRYMAYVPEEPDGSDFAENCPDGDRFDQAGYSAAEAAYQSALEKAKRESVPFDLPEDQDKIQAMLFFTKRNANSIYQVPVEVEVVHFKNEKDADVASGYSHPPQKFARLKSSEPKPESQNDERKIYDEWGRMLLAYSLEAATNKVEDVGSYVFQKLKEEGFSLTRKRG